MILQVVVVSFRFVLWGMFIVSSRKMLKKNLLPLWHSICVFSKWVVEKQHQTYLFIGYGPLPVTVPTRIITCLVGNPKLKLHLPRLHPRRYRKTPNFCTLEVFHMKVHNLRICSWKRRFLTWKPSFVSLPMFKLWKFYPFWRKKYHTRTHPPQPKISTRKKNRWFSFLHFF